MDFRLRGKVALVIGVDAPLPAAIALALARAGADVAISARRIGALYAAADDIRFQLQGQAGRILPVTVDTADMASVRAAMALAADAFGGLDILATSPTRPVIAGTARCVQTMDRVVDDYANFFTAALPHMQRRGTVRILNICGVACHTGMCSGTFVVPSASWGRQLRASCINDSLAHCGRDETGLSFLETLVASLSQV